MNNNVKIGFEYEFYTKADSTSSVRRRLSELGITGFEVTTDASLHEHEDSNGDFRSGVELRFAVPYEDSLIDRKMKEVELISTDPVLSPTFNDDDSIRGTTGIHFHFGLPKNGNNSICDMLRLVQNVYMVESHIEQLANRSCGRWCRSMGSVVSSIDSTLNAIKMSVSNKNLSILDKFLYVTTNHNDLNQFYSSYLKHEVEYKQLFNLVKTFNNHILNISNSNEFKILANLVDLNSPTPDFIYENGNINIIDSSTSNSTYQFVELVRSYVSICKNNAGTILLFKKFIKNYETASIIMSYIDPIIKVLPENAISFVLNNVDIKDTLFNLYNLRNQHMSDLGHTLIHDDKFIEYMLDEFESMYSPQSVKTISSNWFVDLDGYHYDDNRYYGVNATNIGDFYRCGSPKINTVEFRWASSNISTSHTSLMSYYNYLKSIYLKSFTGEKSMKWGEFTLVDITDSSKRGSNNTDFHTLSVIYENKVVGRLIFDTLSRKLNFKHNNKLNRFICDYSSRNTVGEKHMVKQAIKATLYGHKQRLKSIRKKMKSVKSKKELDQLIHELRTE